MPPALHRCLRAVESPPLDVDWMVFAVRTSVSRPRGGGLAQKCVCVFITAGPSTKLFAWGGGK